MPIEVDLHALAELLGADEADELVNDARALIVGDSVEDLVDFVGSLHGNLDRMRRSERIVVEGGAEGVVVELREHVPLGEERVDADVLHIRRKALVEPQMRPPLHRHQIAEPLFITFSIDFTHHVRDFVRYHQRNALFVRDRCGLRVDQKIHLAERDAAPILHRSRGKIGDREEIELLKGVRNMEEVLKVRKDEKKEAQRRRKSREDRPSERIRPIRSCLTAYNLDSFIHRLAAYQLTFTPSFE